MGSITEIPSTVVHINLKPKGPAEYHCRKVFRYAHCDAHDKKFVSGKWAKGVIALIGHRLRT